MNDDEKIAFDFLRNRNFENINFEPLGHAKPPDFSINDNIGIEVRRLNKLVPVGKNLEAVEKLRYRLEPKLLKLISDLKLPNQNYSVIVSFGYQRPIKLKNSFWRDIKKFIIQNTIEGNFGVNLNFNEQATIRLYRRELKENLFFHLGAWSDRDQGGIVQDDRYNSLKECLKEKEAKTKIIKNQFEEIWLILIDHIYSHVDSRILIDLKRYPRLESNFDKVLIISRFDSNQYVEL